MGRHGCMIESLCNLKVNADRNRDVCVAEVYQPPLRLCLNLFPPGGGAAAAVAARRNGTKSCSGSLVSTSVDLTVLKALFPHPITFDCCCTKGEAVNITAWLSVGGVGHDGKAAFAEVGLAGAKNEK